MDQIMIVAFACEDRTGNLHFIQLHHPIDYNTIIFQDDMIIAENYVIHYVWYKTITVCTEETLELFKQNLYIA